jgi:Family of unknown function (DUF6527)
MSEENVFYRLNDEDPGLVFDCPGCKRVHVIANSFDQQAGTLTISSLTWNWNGDLVKPTVAPSLLIRHGSKNGEVVCHSFIIDGQIQFLGDSTHELANQTVKLEPPKR